MEGMTKRDRVMPSPVLDRAHETGHRRTGGNGGKLILLPNSTAPIGVHVTKGGVLALPAEIRIFGWNGAQKFPTPADRTGAKKAIAEMSEMSGIPDGQMARPWLDPSVRGFTVSPKGCSPHIARTALPEIPETRNAASPAGERHRTMPASV
jgi:hypothetical protein